MPADAKKPAHGGSLSLALDFGPLLVGMDAHGGSLFAQVQADVAARRDAVLAGIGASE